MKTVYKIVIFYYAFMACSVTNNAQVYINEFLASNATIIASPDTDEYSDWVELYNDSNMSIDLSSWSITDNISDTTKWILPSNTSIPAYGYLLLWCDGLSTGIHTSFGLSKAGEEIAIYDANLQHIDSYIFTEQKTNISQGRKQDGGSEWGYFILPTPGQSNNTSMAYSGITPYEPIINPSGGFYDATQQVIIDNVANVGQIRYTLDGRVPEATDPIYTGPITIDQTTVLRARMYMNDSIPGPIITNTYFINESFGDRQLAVLSLSTDPAYFWDSEIGLYVQDFKPVWEYPIHLEFYEADGTFGFHHDAGVQVDGENSWKLPQKMLSIFSRDEYGADYIDYQIFPDNQRTQFENIILRCSGNDWSHTLFRDGLEQSLYAENTTVDIQDFRPCMVYINGAYLGIHNLRVRQDEEYLSLKYNIDADSIDMIENNGSIELGDSIAYHQLLTRIENGVSDDGAFAELTTMMDIDNYTDYMIGEWYCANTSWGHNIQYWRPKTIGGKFKWLALDFDRGFYLSSVNGVGLDFFTTPNGAEGTNSSWATIFIRSMLENEGYKNYFINRLNAHLLTTWHPDVIGKKINRFKGLIDQEMPNHIERWAGTTSSYGDAMPSYNFWENEVTKLHEFAAMRTPFLFNNAVNYFVLPPVINLGFGINIARGGVVNVEHLPIADFPRNGHCFAQRDLHIVAKPNIGFLFSHWEKVNTNSSTIFDFNSDWKYYDGVAAPTTEWNTVSYNDNGWLSGNGSFGYGESDETTVLSYGGDPEHKTMTYYFRKDITIPQLVADDYFTLSFYADDGLVLYINGQEAYQYNMDEDTITHQSPAASIIAGADEQVMQSVQLNSSFFVQGSNTIAIELHQIAMNSSDLSFDAKLEQLEFGNSETYSFDDSLLLNITEPLYLRANFQSNGLCLLPDTINSNTQLLASCSPYYALGDVVINPSVTLTIDPGVEIRMPQDACIYVYGQVIANGQADNEIIISTTTEEQERWGGLLFQNNTDTSYLSYMTLNKAWRGAHQPFYKAAIAGYNTLLKMDHIKLIDVLDNPIFARYSHIELKNSIIHSIVTGDGINVKQGYALVDNCEFYGDDEVDMDGIDFDGITGGYIANCVIHHYKGDNNDGLDIGESCADLVIENNFIHHCYDKGISVGQRSTASLYNNLVTNCNIGIAIKDQSEIDIDQHVFYANEVDIAAYEKNPGYKGGNGLVTNSLLTNSLLHNYTMDSTCHVFFANSLTDRDTLSANNNITADPSYLSPNYYNFELRPNSPVLGIGTQGQNLGTSLNYAAPYPAILISEINYDPLGDGNQEFLEIYNPSDVAIDLSGTRIDDAIKFEFPPDSWIDPKEFIILTESDTAYSDLACKQWTWTSGQLANEGELISLRDGHGMLLDFVHYGVSNPWPDTTITMGHSIELYSDSLDNHFASSWVPTVLQAGSPGYSDWIDTTISNVHPDQYIVSENTIRLYPNPAIDILTLYSTEPELSNVQHLTITDLMGRVVYSYFADRPLNSIHIPVSTMSQGLYIINTGNEKLKFYKRNE